VKAEWRIFAAGGAFFLLATAIYWFASAEYAGTVLLGVCAPATLLVAAWLLLQHRRVGERPEDRGDADPSEGAGEVGYFPTSSVWPLVLGAGAVVLANALVFGIALVVPGVILVAIAVVGYAVEASSKA
jgi:hypothetical protein